MSSDGSVTFKTDPQRAEADLAVQYGFLLLLNVLGLQHDVFKLESLKEPLDKCFSCYREIYLADEPIQPGDAVELDGATC